MIAGELYRLARVLREVALAGTSDPGEAPVSLGLVAIVEDIGQHGPTTVGEVATRTGLAQSQVSKTVAQLRAAGVVEARQDEADRRRTRVSVSDTARSRIFEVRSRRGITDALQDRFPHLTPKQVASVEAQLERLLRQLRP